MILKREKLTSSYATFDIGQAQSKKAWVPARYIFAIMAMLGIMFAYIMRACLSIAITEMVIKKEFRGDITNDNVCPSTVSEVLTSNTSSEATFDWDEKTQGIILSAFYYGYIITHIPGGLLAQRFGGKYTLGLGILSTSMFTLLTPLVAHMGAFALILLRFFEGLGEGVTFPALCNMLSFWAPPSERSTMATVTFAGGQLGAVMANMLGGIILEYVPGGWESVFYIFGSASIIWFTLWCLLCFNDPLTHPYISESERLYLKYAIGHSERKRHLNLPWKNMLTSIPVWSLIVAQVGHDWGLFTILTDLPKYINDVMRFNSAMNGFWSSMPYLANWVTSLIASTFADWIEIKRIVSMNSLRKTFATIAAVGPAVGVIAASYVGCDKMTAMLLLVAGMGLMGFSYSSLRVNSLDLSPNYSGTIMALVNGSGCISGMIAPIFTGLVTPNGSLLEWRIVFWTMAIFLLSTNFVYILFGSAQQQDWDDQTEEGENNIVQITNYKKTSINENSENVKEDNNSKLSV